MSFHVAARRERSRPTCLERFERYVRVDTQSQRDRESSPSTPGQLDLARMLVGELKDADLTDVDAGRATATCSRRSPAPPARA